MMFTVHNLLCVLVNVCIFSCGTVDGAYGPVRNPWQYHFRQTDNHTASSLQSVHRASQHARDYHVSSSRCAGSTNPHHTVRSSDGHMAGDTEVSDWYITGGSSGGSAVAVATGVAFAWVYTCLCIYFLCASCTGKQVLFLVVSACLSVCTKS